MTTRARRSSTRARPSSRSADAPAANVRRCRSGPDVWHRRRSPAGAGRCPQPAPGRSARRARHVPPCRPGAGARFREAARARPAPARPRCCRRPRRPCAWRRPPRASAAPSRAGPAVPLRGRAARAGALLPPPGRRAPAAARCCCRRRCLRPRPAGRLRARAAAAARLPAPAAAPAPSASPAARPPRGRSAAASPGSGFRSGWRSCRDPGRTAPTTPAASLRRRHHHRRRPGGQPPPAARTLPQPSATPAAPCSRSAARPRC